MTDTLRFQIGTAHISDVTLTISFLSFDYSHASCSVVIFVMHSLSVSKFSTSFLLLLDLYSDYEKINISLKNSSSLFFLNIYSPPICSSSANSRMDFFSPSVFPLEISILWETSIAILLSLGLRKYSCLSWRRNIQLSNLFRPLSSQ